MHLKLLARESRLLYKEPVMLMVTPTENRLRFTFKETVYRSDKDLLDQFIFNNESKAIAIDGLEEGNIMIEVRAFIFTARKRFDPGTRPLILIYTQYTLDELRRKSFTGLESEILQYGNCAIICKKDDAKNQQKLFKKYGITSIKKKMEIHEYVGRQYE